MSNATWPETSHPLHHGGFLRVAAETFGVPLREWLDLSTGINPVGWPVPAVPATAWRRLPEADDGLEAAARGYYGADYLLPVSGSQAAIQALPRLRATGRVAVLHPGYAEHAHAWRAAGHDVRGADADALDAEAARADVLVLCRPNNPTGERIDPARIESWRKSLAGRGGWLVVDEAFVDTTPNESLLHHGARDALVVLRSLGKFFGLAGARVGFVFAAPDLLARLDSLLGPWAVGNASRWVAARALADRAWQSATRARLEADGLRLRTLLERYGLAARGESALFQWVPTPDAAMLHDALAHRGILVRRFEDPPALRFGLPADDAGFERLDATLGRILRPRLVARGA